MVGNVVQAHAGNTPPKLVDSCCSFDCYQGRNCPLRGRSCQTQTLRIWEALGILRKPQG